MKTNQYIKLLFLLMSVNVWSQNTDDLLNGHKVEYYPNGKISKEYNLSNGIVNGVYKSYSEKGYLLTEQNLVDGIPQGDYITYYENGQICSVQNMENGIPQGNHKEFYKDGTMKMQSNLTGDLMEYTGESFLYFENGNLKNHSVFSQGKLTSSIHYDRQGRVTMEETPGQTISYSYDNDGWKHTTVNGTKCQCSRCLSH